MADDESGWSKIIDGTVDVVTKYKLLEKLAGFFVNGREVVLLCGTSGVGKSQFVLSMQDAAAPPISAADRTRGWRRAKVTKDKRKLELLDTPGQVGEGAIRRKAHLQALKAKRFGIINVVANGYHEGTASERSAIVQVNGEYQVRPEFRKKNLELETQSLAEWYIEMLGAQWLITLVNKADLWWHPDTYESVLNYYSGEGAYGKKLESWQGKHIVLPYASTSKPFYERVAMSGYFGDAQRLQCQVGAFQALTAFIEQSKTK